MEIRIEDKAMKTIHCTQEHGDSNLGDCLWANVTIDAENFSLKIQSDGGDMQYSWGNIGDNTPAGFYRFLAKLDKEYFLRKMSNETRFNFDATVEHLLKWLEDSRPDLAKEVHGMPVCANEHEFAAQYLALPGSHTDDLECVVMDYPAGHKAVAGIFCRYVQPRLLDCIPQKADAYFLEVEEDYSPEQLVSLVSKLDSQKRYVPIEVDGDNSHAFGFIDSEPYRELLCEDFGKFSAEMHAVLADMKNETLDGLYTFTGIKTHLYR